VVEFVDSNILVYAFAIDGRSTAAEALLQRRPVISVQGLNEFANVARRKLGMNWDELREALGVIRTFCPVILPLSLDTHERALRLAERFGFATFDALIVASALEADCDILWSEDIQHGLVIDGRLRIANPFRSES
jgi:predicted nucleic acid-binding protein